MQQSKEFRSCEDGSQTSCLTKSGKWHGAMSVLFWIGARVQNLPEISNSFWVGRLWVYFQLSTCGTWDYRWNAFREGEIFLRDSNSYLCEFWKESTENSERLGQQARSGIEPGTSRLPVLNAEPLRHFRGQIHFEIKSISMQQQMSSQYFLFAIFSNDFQLFINEFQKQFSAM